MAKKPEDDWIVAAYLIGGYVLGLLAGVAAFIASWWYCIATYGFLIGVSVGWFPAGIVASVTYGIVRFGWPLIVAGGVYLATR